MIRRRKKLRRGSDRYGVKKIEYAGESFRSKLEVKVRKILEDRVESGEIEILGREVQVHLHEARFIYTPDFHCLDLKTKEEFFVEAKGFETDVWRRNYRLWKYHGPAPLQIYREKPHCLPKIVEIVIPLHACKSCGRPYRNTP